MHFIWSWCWTRHLRGHPALVQRDLNNGLSRWVKAFVTDSHESSSIAQELRVGRVLNGAECWLVGHVNRVSKSAAIASIFTLVASSG